jgi:hypothetical protein
MMTVLATGYQIEMPLLSEWQPSDPVQLLPYGLAKVGKTWGALTAPLPVVFDFDNGIATGRNPEFVKRFGQRWIYYETFRERSLTKGVPTQHNAFDDACRFFDEWMKPSGSWKNSITGTTDKTGRDMFQTFIIDSATSLSEIAQNKAVIVLGGMGLSKSHSEGMKSGLVVPKIQDYGAERSLTEQFIDMVRSSGKNVIVICHEKEVVNDQGSVVRIVPLLTGKSAETIPLKFDEVYNIRVEKKAKSTGGYELRRYLMTQPDGIRKVGTRYGIPDGSEWNWDTVQAALSSIKAEQRGATSPHKE